MSHRRSTSPSRIRQRALRPRAGWSVSHAAKIERVAEAERAEAERVAEADRAEAELERAAEAERAEAERVAEADRAEAELERAAAAERRAMESRIEASRLADERRIDAERVRVLREAEAHLLADQNATSDSNAAFPLGDRLRSTAGERVTVPEVPRPAPPNEPQRDPTAEDELSLSGDFFRDDADSLPPVADQDPIDEPIVAPPSPELLARRARLRRFVGSFVGAVGVAAAITFGVTVFSGAQATAGGVSQANATVGLEAAPPIATDTARDVEPTSNENSPSNAPHPSEAEAASTAQPEPEEPEEKVEATPSADYGALEREALALLNRGKRAEAVTAADAAIAADPEQAMPYLLKGSALTDMGQWPAAVEAYSACVQTAKKGPLHECSALGGKRK